MLKSSKTVKFPFEVNKDKQYLDINSIDSIIEEEKPEKPKKQEVERSVAVNTVTPIPAHEPIIEPELKATLQQPKAPTATSAVGAAKKKKKPKIVMGQKGNDAANATD